MHQSDLEYKNIYIVHNPTAGKEDFSREELQEVLRDQRKDVRYVSTQDPGWERFIEQDPDLIIVAGGDGTVHKLAGVLWGQKGKKVFPPVRVLPTGTANNIAQTLGVSMEINAQELARKSEPVFFDLGITKGLEPREIFLEAVGFGLFPQLMAEREGEEEKAETPHGELLRILREFREIVAHFPARKAKIEADGKQITGKFLLVELMNIRSIGPNLEFAPLAEPGDGFFDLVLIPEDGRDALIGHLNSQIDGKGDHEKLSGSIRSKKVQKVTMEWEGEEIHFDDDLIPQFQGKAIQIEMAAGALRFLR